MVVGKTIQIFLPDGNARGIRIADMTSRTVEAVFFPRPLLEDICKLSDPPSIGVYFLFGERDEGGLPVVYIGESEDCIARFRQHNAKKEFWNAAIVVRSKTNFFTKTHIRYLEWLAYESVINVGRYALENSNAPVKPHVSPSVEADLHDNFETIRVLISTLGYAIFDPIAKPSQSELLYCRVRDVEAVGEYGEDGLVVFAESRARLDEVANVRPWVSNLRAGLVASGALVPDGNGYRFAKDYAFSSPSAAACAVLGRTANGWTEWKYSDGRTLDEVKRQSDISM